jgi:co-chaperonin GroES (HSP10)
MLRTLGIICLCLCSGLAFSEPAATSKYQIATVIAVQVYNSNVGSDTSGRSFEVTVKVGDTLYVVLYTPPYGIETVKYATGAQVLVLVGEKTITYNDIAGNAIESPILSRKTVVTVGRR